MSPVGTPVPEQPERTPVPEQPTRKPFNAPLIAGALALVAVLVVVGISVFRSQSPLAVDDLQSPAVGALGAGRAVYPANSAEAIAENVKFGYLPAVEITQLGDGTLALAHPETGQQDLGLAQPLDQIDAAEFHAARIAPAPLSAPAEEGEPGVTGEGTPVTWPEVLADHGDDTVFMPAVASAADLGPVLEVTREVGRTDGIVVRSADLAVLQEAAAQGIAVLYSGDAPATSPDELLAGGIGMAAVPADVEDLDGWLASDVRVWTTGVESEGELGDLASRGLFGALSENPFAIQPSNVRTD